jgi:hypothetical protein
MMPSDNDMYTFAGPMLGNKVTCQLQGWFIAFGITGSTALNACLTLYFVLQIVFNVDITKMSTYVEPIMYAYTLFPSIVVPTFYLSKDLLNQNPYDSFCTISTYPISCNEDKWYDWNECVWDDTMKTQSSVAIVVISLQFGWIVIGMSMILWKIFNYKREVGIIINEDDAKKRTTATKNLDEEPDRKGVLLQAMMYIFAFFLTWLFNLLSAVFSSSTYGMDILNSTFFPLQGFWNLLIFLYDKTYFIRQDKNNSSGYWQAVRKLISTPLDNPAILVSNIQTIECDQKDGMDAFEYVSTSLSELQMSFPIKIRNGLSIESSFFDNHRSGIVSPIGHTSFHNIFSSNNSTPNVLEQNVQTMKKAECSNVDDHKVEELQEE